jgi:hypothetical protein
MRSTDEAFDLKSENGHLGFWLSVFVSLAARHTKLCSGCSGHQGRLAHATQVDSYQQASRSWGIIQVVFCYFLRRAGMPQSHGYTYGFP